MSALPEPSAGRVLEISRLIDAPRALVFRAWTDPVQLVRWWGPHGYHVPSCRMEVHPGGSYRICMRHTDGTEHWVWGEYREIDPPGRLVFTWRRDKEDGPDSESTVTVTLAEEGTKTRLTLHHAGFATVAARDSHNGGWGECLDRFVAYAASLG